MLFSLKDLRILFTHPLFDIINPTHSKRFIWKKQKSQNGYVAFRITDKDLAWDLITRSHCTAHWLN